MKRFRLGGEVEMESITLANVLVLVSRGSGKEQRESPARVFGCKTCNRQFPSFQALGGHRASHKKPRLLLDGQSQAQVPNAKRRVHGCSMCGLQFATGQALGGHMRCHKSAIEVFPRNGLEEEHSHGKKVVYLDLNLPPPENEMECIELVGNCFYK